MDTAIPFAFNIARNMNGIIPWVDIARNVYSGVIIITRIASCWISWTTSNTALNGIWSCVVIGFNDQNTISTSRNNWSLNRYAIFKGFDTG